jgi:transposase InsO family protein
MITGLIEEATRNGASKARACRAIGLDPTTLKRWEHQGTGDDNRAGPRSSPPNKLSQKERQLVLDTACNQEFRELSPNQIVPLLADRGEYIASEATFHRILRAEKLLNHRGPAREPSRRYKPIEKTANGPCQVWSWDISYLRGPVRGQHYYLYLVLDIWSRMIVGWSIQESEQAEHSAGLISRLCIKHGIERNQLTLHSDNGSPMKGATMLATLYDLGVGTSFSRPRVSNDNPFSESLFRTLKYRPEFPSKPFASIESAKEWVAKFADWYNHSHLHSGIRFVAPATRHAGRHREVLRKRGLVIEAARKRNPNRWSGPIRNLDPIDTVRLNPDPEEAQEQPAA